MFVLETRILVENSSFNHLAIRATGRVHSRLIGIYYFPLNTLQVFLLIIAIFRNKYWNVLLIFETYKISYFHGHTRYHFLLSIHFLFFPCLSRFYFIRFRALRTTNYRLVALFCLHISGADRCGARHPIYSASGVCFSVVQLFSVFRLVRIGVECIVCHGKRSMRCLRRYNHRWRSKSHLENICLLLCLNAHDWRVPQTKNSTPKPYVRWDCDWTRSWRPSGKHNTNRLPPYWTCLPSWLSKYAAVTCWTRLMYTILPFPIRNWITVYSESLTLAFGNPNIYKSESYVLVFSVHLLLNTIIVVQYCYLTFIFILSRYGPLDEDEYEIIINEQNTWKDEIMMRMSLDKAVSAEIEQMPCRYMKFKNVPYHLYPFSEQLNSKNQGLRYYVLSASANYYRQLLSNEWYLLMTLYRKAILIYQHLCY